jgi:hypothetical protein
MLIPFRFLIKYAETLNFDQEVAKRADKASFRA